MCLLGFYISHFGPFFKKISKLIKLYLEGGLKPEKQANLVGLFIEKSCGDWKNLGEVYV